MKGNVRQQAPLLSRAYLEALRAADAAGAYRMLAQARERGMRLFDLYDLVITPAMYEVGRLWARGALTIADEHLATEVTQRALTALRADVIGGPGDATRQEMPRAMLAAVQGEQHILGLRMAADLVEDAGYETLYLGADVPTGDLLTAVESLSPDLLGLSVTMPELGPVLAETVRRAHRARPGLDLYVGGQAGASQRLRGATPVKDLASLDERLRQHAS